MNSDICLMNSKFCLLPETQKKKKKNKKKRKKERERERNATQDSAEMLNPNPHFMSAIYLLFIMWIYGILDWESSFYWNSYIVSIKR